MRTETDTLQNLSVSQGARIKELNYARRENGQDHRRLGGAEGVIGLHVAVLPGVYSSPVGRRRRRGRSGSGSRDEKRDTTQQDTENKRVDDRRDATVHECRVAVQPLGTKARQDEDG
jgi:hypothetical protein